MNINAEFYFNFLYLINLFYVQKMEFAFNVNDIFKAEVAVIRNSLVPDGFVGDYQSRAQCSAKVATILADMGEASAKAQGLHKAITSGDKLKNSEHIVYLLMSCEDYDGKGSVIGLLKVGQKKLFVFDQYGYQHEVEPMCILDFYVHESRQRMGCGKQLFEFMLQDQNILPQNLAIDKPSEKFLAFLYKHYQLENAVPQMNNFVIFDGFFDYGEGDKEKLNNNNRIKRTKGLPSDCYKSINRNSMHELYGRYSGGRHAAPKAESTMGLILKDPCPASDALSDGNGACMRNSWGGDGSPSMTPEPEVRCPAADFLSARNASPVVLGEKYRHSRLW